MSECHASTAAYAKILDDLYAGTLDDAAWDRAIIGIADLVRASGALLFAVNPSDRAILRDESHRFDPSALADYRRYWTFQDCRQVHLMDAPIGSPMTESMMPISNWRQTPILNEFLLPADAPHFMPAWLHKSETKFVTLSLLGSIKRGPFESQDIDNFSRVLPHVRRALEIRDRLERARVRTATLSTLLDVGTYGVAVLDGAGKLLEANTVLQEHLCRDCGIRRDADGTLRLREPAGTQLRRWIATGLPSEAQDGLLRVRRRDGSSVSVTVTPLPVPPTSWIAGDPRWLVLIFDPDRQVQVSADLIARDLGVSAREAEVAASLLAGYNAREVAARLRVSEHTIRAQLKSIFRKTGLRSQSELVRRIALGPAVQSPRRGG